MKKIKLGTMNVNALTERELKNVLGGVEAPSSSVVTKSAGGSTQSLANYDGDPEHIGDADWNRIEKEE